jgi:hypothetical protein
MSQRVHGRFLPNASTVHSLTTPARRVVADNLLRTFALQAKVARDWHVRLAYRSAPIRCCMLSRIRWCPPHVYWVSTMLLCAEGSDARAR